MIIIPAQTADHMFLHPLIRIDTIISQERRYHAHKITPHGKSKNLEDMLSKFENTELHLRNAMGIGGLWQSY